MTLFYLKKKKLFQLIFTDVKNNATYITTDEGKTFRKLGPLPFSPDQLQFHPTKEDWVLAYDFTLNQVYFY